MALAKGYTQRRSRAFRVAKEAVMKAGQYAYRDRRQRKRVFRSLWIAASNAAAREHNLSYSAFMNGLRRAASTWIERSWPDMAVLDKAGVRGHRRSGQVPAQRLIQAPIPTGPAAQAGLEAGSA